MDETIAWLDAHPSSEKEEYEEKQKALEGKANPIMMKLYGGGGGGASGTHWHATWCWWLCVRRGRSDGLSRCARQQQVVRSED